MLATASALPTLYARAATREDRKALLSRVFARIEVENREIVRIEYRPPFALLFGDTRERTGSGCDDMARALLDGRPTAPVT